MLEQGKLDHQYEPKDQDHDEQNPQYGKPVILQFQIEKRLLYGFSVSIV
jgi:hypothetical protein